MQNKEQIIEILNESNKLFESYIGLLNNLILSIEPKDKPLDIKKDNIKKEVIKKEEVKPTLKLEDVRKVLVNKSREGYTKQIRDLLIKYGADKLSEIKPENYQTLLDEVSCLGATLEMIEDELKKKQECSEQFKAVYEYHFATSLHDLKEEDYSGFLRDIRGLRNE